MSSTRQTKNVGEWSELYALAYLLGHGGGYGADDNQDPIKSLFYKILAALFKNEKESADLTFKVDGKEVLIYVDQKLNGRVSRAQLLKLASALHGDLLSPPSGRAFALSKGDELLDALMKNKTSTSSGSYNDICLKFEDSRTKTPSPFIGFSIKSHINAKSTLLNASLATNFVYEIVPRKNKPSASIPSFGLSLKQDMQKLVSAGYTLKFLNIDNKIHQQNMELVDSNLARYMARCLFETTQHSNGHFSRIAEIVFPSGKEENKAIQLKLKQYLGYVMLGMRPTTKWSGQPNDFGGLILVKKSGDVLFYYLYNMNDFQNFLYKNLKFEYGKRSRHKFGKPYKENGKTLIKLNLQLRFI